MFRRKPPTSPPPDPVPSPGWVHGFHYLAPQSALIFGRNRRTPVTWRPGVSLTRHGAFTVLLPATRQAHSDFFHLKPGDVFSKKAPNESPTDSYLCPRYETVTHQRLIERGVLRHGLRIDIAAWLKQRLGSSHG